MAQCVYTRTGPAQFKYTTLESGAHTNSQVNNFIDENLSLR